MIGNYSKIEAQASIMKNIQSALCRCFPTRETRRWCRSSKIFAVPIILIFLVTYYYYWDFDDVPLNNSNYEHELLADKSKIEPNFQIPRRPPPLPHDIPIPSTLSNIIEESVTEFVKSSLIQIVDTVKTFPTFNFSDFEWTNSVDYFWNNFFESRYQNEEKTHPLKIIVIPHSHNDPGWGWTYEEYFHDKTFSIINMAVDKLIEYPKMTFQWSEASFMDIWWLTASKERKSNLKQLIHDKRFEIVTGGWVMTDEAIVPLYSMIDQLVEGQHWFKYHLDVLPQTSWSVDPFGFGSTFPYLLKISGIDSMIILRIHYAWKKWMAENQAGDFYWLQRWDDSKRHTMLCHQAFYTMYLIASSLGPHSEVCKKFDFVSEKKSRISSTNIGNMAKDFVEEAGRTASLFKHNVALPILGADFTFRFKEDWDSTYKNYMQLFDYINSNKELFNGTEVKFGTVSEYFKEIRERQEDFPSLVGDFFPYSDTQSKPLKKTAYWSGFYASRPFWKKMHRETEHSVRTAEILFTIANAVSKNDIGNTNFTLGISWTWMNGIQVSYPKLVKARQYLGLFSHHDASPGVSSARVMVDYERKLNTAIENGITVQLIALETILNHLELSSVKLRPWHKLSDPVKQYREWRDKILDLDKVESIQILLFNSLGWEREQFVKLLVKSPRVGVMDQNGNFIKSQVNPVITFAPALATTQVSELGYELVFIAKVPALSVSTIFTIKRLNEDSSNIAEKSKIASNMMDSIGNVFEKSESVWDNSGDDSKIYYLTNEQLKLGFNTATGLLKTLENKVGSQQINMNFGGYFSVAKHSGPYLFMADKNRGTIKVPFGNTTKPEIFVFHGPISSEIIVNQTPFRLFARILHAGSEDDRNAIFIENQFDSKLVPGEYFMRFDTDIRSTSDTVGGKSSEVFYTDQSGYAFEKRVKVDSIGIEGNYYPVTTVAFIQDEESGKRFSILVDRSHGAASLTSGSLEVMIERRLLYDDNRGIGQGITDNRLTTSNYVLKLEQISPENMFKNHVNSKTTSPTLAYHHQSQALNYPLSIYILESSELIDPSKISPFRLFSKDLPQDTVFLNFRTLPKFSNGNSMDAEKPFSESYSSKALMIFHKIDFVCEENKNCKHNTEKSQPIFENETKFHTDVSPKSIERTDLAGLRTFSTIPSEKVRFEDLSSIYCDKNEISSFVLVL